MNEKTKKTEAAVAEREAAAGFRPAPGYTDLEGFYKADEKARKPGETGLRGNCVVTRCAEGLLIDPSPFGLKGVTYTLRGTFVD